MGIFGALTTAVSGLRAQSYSLENISGNIANSQTTGFKRVDTSFVDLIPDAPFKHEVSGSVSALSRLTNTIQGDLQSTGVPTHMALNGEGYFVVQQRSGYNNNKPIFGGVDFYTRRGDFSLDKDGYLVNGAGYYIKGSSIDPVSGETKGAGSGVIQVSSEPLPARQTSLITYRANLPSRPATSNASSGKYGAELLAAPPGAPAPPAPAFPAGYDPRIVSLPAPAGSGFVVGSDQSRFTSQSISGGSITVYNAVGAPIDVQLRWAKVQGDTLPAKTTGGTSFPAPPAAASVTGNLTINSTTFPFAGTEDANAVRDAINAQSAVTNVTASLDAGNRLVLTANDSATSITVSGTAAASAGLAAGTSSPSAATETWNLFYLKNSRAVGNQPAWQNVGVPIQFNSSGQMTSPAAPPEINVAGLTVDGATIGNVKIDFGNNGLTQYASASGLAQASTIQQDGYPSGTLDSVSVTADGRISGNYSNGRVVPVAQVSVAQFNADNALKRLDGGVYEQTLESGLPIIGLNGATVIGANLEGSNTDIAEEFSKMIVTQQAYSANTKVVSTSQQMLSDVLNMIR